MTVTPEDIQSLYDAEVVDSEGQRVGGVGHVYLDDDSGRPAWVTAKTGLFGLRETFVPLHGADVAVGEIRVPYTKDFIKDAPNIDDESHLDDDDQQQLSRYYRLDASDGVPVYGEDSVHISSPAADDLATSGSLRSHAGSGSDLGTSDVGASDLGTGMAGTREPNVGQAGAADNAADAATVGGTDIDAGGRADIDARGAGADRSGDSYTDMDTVGDVGVGRAESQGLLGKADTPAVAGTAASEGSGADRSGDLYTDRDVQDSATGGSDGLLGNADTPVAAGQEQSAARADAAPASASPGSRQVPRTRIRKHQYGEPRTPAPRDRPVL
jgi:sporulation protein YlmC with PRC-barrel domain